MIRIHKDPWGGNGITLLWERVAEWFCCFIVWQSGEKEAVPMTEQVRDIKDNLDPLAPLSDV